MTEQVTTEQIAQTGSGSPPPPAEPQATESESQPAMSNVAPPENQPAAPGARPAEGLLGDNGAFIERWNAIQGTFVDEPRQAVEQADALVAEVIKELARVFADERQRLETAWSGGSAVSTEDLRQALQKYRDFFQTLLRS